MPTLLQIKVDEELKEAIQNKAKKYGVPVSSLLRITLRQIFLENDKNDLPGNVFNADRDNEGKGISVDDFLGMLNS